MTKTSNKSAFFIGGTIAFMFLLTALGHVLFKGQGHGEGHGETASHHEVQASPHEAGREVTVYESRESCEEATHQPCVLQICDDIPAGEHFEDTCGEGFSKGWQPQNP